MHRFVKAGLGRRQPAGRGERGQAMVLIAMAMIGLLAFIGLMVDAGLLFIGVGHLRRAVDAAALAAAAQFREGRDLEDQAAAAREVIHLNGVDPTELILRVCTQNTNYPPEYNRPELCPSAPDDPQRKLIYIQAKSRVQFAFLTIIGFHSTDIVADAVSEAASVDVVLVIDTSDSMARDGSTALLKKPENCNPLDDCHPFKEVKEAAKAFVRGMYFPYDRVAVVTFDNVYDEVLSLADSSELTEPLTETLNLISGLQVSPERVANNPPNCVLNYVPGSNPLKFIDSVNGCPNTSIGGGLLAAAAQFGRQPIRQDSVWVVILLTDGAANASIPNPDDSTVTNWYCPPTDYDPDGTAYWLQPFCRDGEADLAFTSAHTRRAAVNPSVWGRATPYNPSSEWAPEKYDADDFAATMADHVACAPVLDQAAEWCKDSLDYTSGEGGQGATIYAIGLGPLVTCIGSINSATNVCEDRPSSGWTQGRPDAGDRLLRYIANVGLDGDPNPIPGSGGVGLTDPCISVAVPYPLTAGNDSYNCGNYYFSESGTGLAAVFESIASRIFTRLTK